MWFIILALIGDIILGLVGFITGIFIGLYIDNEISKTKSN